MKLTVCNRCRHTDKEDDFEGMDVTIFNQGGVGSREDSFTLCDPCTDALRKWIVTKPEVQLTATRAVELQVVAGKSDSSPIPMGGQNFIPPAA